jgi:hypothetical protein
MESFDIARLEEACIKLYSSTDPNERNKVTNELVSVSPLYNLLFLIVLVRWRP